MDWFYQQIEEPDPVFYHRAVERQRQLTKPPGSLGRLEEMAARLAAMQGVDSPLLERVWISVFAADHGISEESVSAFPRSVTVEMVRNFAAGGAAINVLARQINAHLEVIDTGVLQLLGLDNVIESRAGNGTSSFLRGDAMTGEQLKTAMDAGKKAVDRALLQQTQLFIGRDMWIGNTTSATAVACALTGISAMDVTGVAGEDVVLQDCKVSELAGLDAPLDALLEGDVGPVQCVDPDGVHRRDGLVLP